MEMQLFLFVFLLLFHEEGDSKVSIVIFIGLPL